MENIFCLVTVLSVTEKDIRDAFGQRWKDFEDCVQYMTGRNNRMDYLITANRKDYKDVSLPVLTPTEWLGRADNYVPEDFRAHRPWEQEHEDRA